MCFIFTPSYVLHVKLAQKHVNQSYTTMRFFSTLFYYNNLFNGNALVVYRPRAGKMIERHKNGPKWQDDRNVSIVLRRRRRSVFFICVWEKYAEKKTWIAIFGRKTKKNAKTKMIFIQFFCYSTRIQTSCMRAKQHLVIWFRLCNFIFDSIQLIIEINEKRQSRQRLY